MSKSIKFILQELANNAENRERFNKNNFGIKFEFLTYFPEILIGGNCYQEFSQLSSLEQVSFIRIVLSQVDGRAVLGALEGEYEIEPEPYAFFDWEWWQKHAYNLVNLIREEQMKGFVYDDEAILPGDLSDYLDGLSKKVDKYYPKTITDFLYQTFDTPLRNGEGLEKALEALDKYFIEEGEIVKLNVK